MDTGKLSEILKKTKEKIEQENEVFIRALNQRIENEKKFRSAINCILKHTESTVEVLSLHEQLESNQCDTQTIIKAKKDLKYVADLRMKLEIEVNLSRKRMKRLEKSSYDYDPRCIKSSNVIEIPDSPPKLFDDSDKAKTKVSIFTGFFLLLTKRTFANFQQTIIMY